MSANKVINTILKTIDDVQQKNKSNPYEETADKNVFGILKEQLRNLDRKTKNKRVAKGKSPEGILDLIKKEIEGVRTGNRRDPNVRTAPKSVFDNILKKVEEPRRRQASAGLGKLVQDYNLDVSKLPREVIQSVQSEYIKERKKFDQQFANAIYKVVKQYR